MNSNIQETFNTYPEAARSTLLSIRAAIYEIAAEESLGEVVESLKWGEPSYQTKSGSALRLGWKEKSPDTISVYFNCKTILIETFKEIYQDTFTYLGSRELVFNLAEELPLVELKACVSMALRYHKIKHLPLLGE